MTTATTAMQLYTEVEIQDLNTALVDEYEQASTDTAIIEPYRYQYNARIFDESEYTREELFSLLFDICSGFARPEAPAPRLFEAIYPGTHRWSRRVRSQRIGRAITLIKVDKFINSRHIAA